MWNSEGLVARIAKLFCPLVLFLASFTFRTDSIALAQSGNSSPEQRAEELIDKLRQAPGKGVDVWGKWIRELIELGPPAVEPVCKALRGTEDRWEIRVYGFVLRGINDPRAVPALIESIPKTLLPTPRESVGPCPVSNPDLLEFLVKHEAYANLRKEKDFDRGFTFGEAQAEICAALNAITGQAMNEKELFFINLSGSPAQRNMKRELFHENAIRWKAWWELHAHEFNVPESFRKVELPAFDSEMHEVNDVFANGEGVATESWHVVFSPIESGTIRTFLDLDTGRWAGLPAELDASMSSPEQVFQWANENHFDLYCCTVTLPGSDNPIYALRPVNLELWQNDSFAFDEIIDKVQIPEGEPGTPVADYLIGRDPESQALVPDEEAVFLFRTADGTCGAIKYICIVDHVVPPDELHGRSLTDIPPNTFARPGVRVETMNFAGLDE